MHLHLKLKESVIPQGIGAKIAFDYYGESFPELRKDYNEQSNYIGVDLGFNTVDVFQVINGKTTPNLIRGIENQGIIRVVISLIRHIKDAYQVNLTDYSSWSSSMLITEYYECSCYSDEHMLKFILDDNLSDGPELYTSIFLSEHPWYKRIWIAIKYAFGHKSKYGHWDCWLLIPTDAKRLRDLLNKYIVLSERKENGITS